ncbi:uncharacterized protein BHQ10_009570 [Talaromyces amestolkiae]|uniref:Peptidase S8/S53 domain-containing protein n=1 Tax=Talaromyces amestolkiae TaxID=1196081 RepID=A0A364LCM4_TALAM|nr:uncharacterized protein BHQ10_009570 [Talaromyces amestolkiae]RAO73558.1 hypothetical protein BHQ10_009570 [Talaromyces amestolkiae]
MVKSPSSALMCTSSLIFVQYVLDAESFTEYLKNMKQRLLQMFVQGPYYDENIVYFQVSEALTFGSYQGPKVNIAIISSNLKSRDKQKARMIVTREGNADSSVEDKILEFAQQGLLKSLPKINLWVCEYHNFGNLTVSRTNWNKLRTRGKKPKEKLQATDPGGTFVLRQNKRSSDDWLDEVDDLISVIKAPEALRGTYEKVKVAVIDTGFHPSDCQASKVKEYKDFIDEKAKDMCDNTWHGTMSANLILSIYEECELYVARVFNKNETDEMEGPLLMASVRFIPTVLEPTSSNLQNQAIKWAIEPGRKVDIISISAGFRNHSPSLQSAIEKASDAGVLIFAAASNWGNRGREAFPARHKFKTICIFSTNTDDQASHFNPEARDDADNFAILGEDFPHPTNDKKREDGTSMATAIAAGLAARILDFTRQPDNKEIVRVEDVGKMAGMTAIFSFMAKKAGKFNCVAPLRLLEERYARGDYVKNRAYVRDSISRAMETAN